MNNKRNRYKRIFTSAILFLSIIAAASAYCEVRASYLYHLSNFSGTVPYMWPKVRVDNANREVYVISQNGVRVFNDSGMEVYDFSHRLALSNNHDVAVDEKGNIYVLFAYYNVLTRESSYSLDRCNYKMEPVAKIALTGLPPELADFIPYRIFFRNGLFYLGNPGTMKIVVTDKQGLFQRKFDLAAVFGTDEERQDASMSDFFVDRDGSILFTAPVIARAYRVSPDGTITTFGQRGSAPGRFSVPAGIVADSRGNYLVSDKLKSAIIMFDKNFNFIAEFGFRGPRPENLIVPSGLTIDDRDRLYVSQLAKRGVSVFQIVNK